MMKRIFTGLVALLLFCGTAHSTTLNTFGKTDGLSLAATREQNANIAALQTIQDKQDVTAGTVTASKIVVVNSTKDIGDFRNLDAVNIDAGVSGTAGTVDIFPATASRGKLALSVTDQTGDTTVSLVAGAMGAARTITLRDPGAAASFLTTTDATAAATTATAVELNYLDITTLGTGAASKAVVLDAGDDYTWPASGVLKYGVLKDSADTTLGATVAELNGAADLSTQVMTAGAGFAGTGTIYKVSAVKHGSVIVTTFLLDLTGTSSSTTDLDIIGTSGVSYIGQITAALSGTVLGGTMTCLEVPTGGIPDIDLYYATEGTGAFDGAIGDLAETALVTAGGNWTLGLSKPFIADPAADSYLYLTGGAAGTAAPYTAGRFLIEIYGY